MTSEIILQAVVTGLMMGLIYALIAAGLSLIFGLMEIVNFAHGEHLMLSMFSSFWLWSLFGLDLSPSLRGFFSLELTLGDIKDLDIELEPQVSQESNPSFFNLS